MLYSCLLVLSAFGLVVQGTESYAPLPTPLHKRQLMTCEQAYGNGSIPCGDEDSKWCYNPDLGQSCCPSDGGFCPQGSYCAPVAGYCCPKGEDPESCAENAGFTLPATAIETAGRSMTRAAEISRTFSVTPFLTPGPNPTPMGSLNADKAVVAETAAKSVAKPAGDFPACYQAPSIATSIAVQIPNSTIPSLLQVVTSSSHSVPAPTSTSPVVHVSIATRNDRILAGSVAIIAMGSVFAVL
ncbi:hypothetical protein GGS21DRAFT_492447 [Xylaria nigripes]|nr:hypothetical protein GGS21DRAFT_492447 [Xylaria nigripes]